MTKNRSNKFVGNFSSSTKKKTEFQKKNAPVQGLQVYFVSPVTSIKDGKMDGRTPLSNLKKGWNFSINENGDFGGVMLL